jgi:hypothetical protein
VTTRRQRFRANPNHKSTLRALVVTLDRSLDQEASEVVGISAGRAVPVAQGLHCKAPSFSRVFGANERHICDLLNFLGTLVQNDSSPPYVFWQQLVKCL